MGAQTWIAFTLLVLIVTTNAQQATMATTGNVQLPAGVQRPIISALLDPVGSPTEPQTFPANQPPITNPQPPTSSSQMTRPGITKQSGAQPTSNVQAATNPPSTRSSIARTGGTDNDLAALIDEGFIPDPDRFVSIDNCVGCIYSNQICSKPNTTNCNAYIECFYEGTNLQAVRRHCAFGLMWDKGTRQCLYASEVTCKQDPCKKTLTVSYPYDYNCRAYWQCINGKSVATCCDVGFGYVFDQGCIEDISCNRSCQSIDKDFTDKPRCSLRAHDTNPGMFKQYETHGQWTDKYCGANTVFSLKLCVCVASGAPAPLKCAAQMKFDFNGDYKDKSRKGTYPGKQNLELRNGSLLLTGDSKITFWLFSRYHFGNQITLKLRFKEHDINQAGVETLVSNCGRNDAPSIDITINREIGAKLILFTIDTESKEPHSFHLPYTGGEWNDVMLSYDGQFMKARVNLDTISEALAGGNVEQRPANMYIGKCGPNFGYRGFIDDLEFYKCAID